MSEGWEKIDFNYFLDVNNILVKMVKEKFEYYDELWREYDKLKRENEKIMVEKESFW